MRNPETGDTFQLELPRHLEFWQAQKMFRNPEMMRQFARYVANIYAEKLGAESMEVYADVGAILNNRKPQPFLDPSVDLAAEPFRLFSSYPWVLDQRLPPVRLK